MENRETTTITTPKENHEVIIKTYLTGYEKRAIVAASLPKKVDFEVATSSGQAEIDLAQMTAQAEDTIIKTIVVSVDGKSENLVEAILNMHSVDTDFVVAAIKKVADQGEEKKTI